MELVLVKDKDYFDTDEFKEKFQTSGMYSDEELNILKQSKDYLHSSQEEILRFVLKEVKMDAALVDTFVYAYSSNAREKGSRHQIATEVNENHGNDSAEVAVQVVQNAVIEPKPREIGNLQLWFR